VPHLAEVVDGRVTRVIVVHESYGRQTPEEWAAERLGGTWVRTSYNTREGQHTEGGEPLRKNYAGIGFTYDETRDAFIPPQPFASWVLVEETCQWEAPEPMPNDGQDYEWDEQTRRWVRETPR
jgi:hypothetical protein